MNQNQTEPTTLNEVLTPNNQKDETMTTETTKPETAYLITEAELNELTERLGNVSNDLYFDVDDQVDASDYDYALGEAAEKVRGLTNVTVGDLDSEIDSIAHELDNASDNGLDVREAQRSVDDARSEVEEATEILRGLSPAPDAPSATNTLALNRLAEVLEAVRDRVVMCERRANDLNAHGGWRGAVDAHVEEKVADAFRECEALLERAFEAATPEAH